MLLEVQDLHVFYGKIEAIKGISFSVNEGEIVSLIGANGAGKTTTLRTISGVRPVAQGRVLFEGIDITNMASHDRVKLGICQAPEGRGIFPGMSVRENLEMGTYVRGYKSDTKAADLEHVVHLFPRLGERMTQLGGTLSGGERQRVGLARAFYGNPAFIVLDEPNSSLDEQGDADLARAITQLKAKGSTFIVMTHRTSVLSVADKMLVLRDGQLQMFGPRDEVLKALAEAVAKASQGAVVVPANA